MRQIQIWMYPGCMASAITGLLDIFTAANAMWAHRHPELAGPPLGWQVCSRDGAPVRTVSGVLLQADAPIDPAHAADVVILPGIFVDSGAASLLRDLEHLHYLVPPLQKMHARGSVLASNCSASFLLAETGLLDGGHATTAWWLARTFRERYPRVELRAEATLTEYRAVICTGAATTFLNLALHLVERFCGPDIATQCARVLLIDANRQSQAAYISLSLQDSLSHGDNLVLRGQKWMQARLDKPFTLGELAHHLSVSERTVIRHFHKALHMTPTDYAQQLRIDAGKRLLSSSTLSLAAVSDSVGYQDVSAFRRLFKRETGLSPTQYRQRFRQLDQLAAST